MKKMINLKINNIPVTVPEGTTVLQAAKSVNIEIPSLCYLKDINCIGACRVCVVEIKGRRGLTASCTYPVEEGLEVFTNTAAVRASRKTTIELILSTHHKKCLSCVRGNHCELQKLAYDYGIDEITLRTMSLSTRSTIPRLMSFATTTSVSSVCAASPPAIMYRGSAPSARSEEVSTSASVLLSTKAWIRRPA